jgi:hypothetical protein
MNDRKRIHRFPIALAACAAALACLLAACDTAGSGPEMAPTDLASAREKWSRNEPAEYSYYVLMRCFCQYDTLFVVANRDSVLSAVAKGTWRPLGGDTLPNPQAWSIDSLFADLESMRNRNPHKLFCHFDPAYGFPDSLDYDGNANAVDDELTRTVFGFRPVLTR